MSELTGLSPSALRYYEDELLLTDVKRDSANRRMYDEHDLDWISAITCLKNSDMPIEQIKVFVRLNREGDSTLEERLRMITEHRKTVQAEIDRMNTYMDHINYKVDYYTEACRLGTEKDLKARMYPGHIHTPADDRK